MERIFTNLNRGREKKDIFKSVVKRFKFMNVSRDERSCALHKRITDQVEIISSKLMNHLHDLFLLGHE